jgi:hypothetical protein
MQGGAWEKKRGFKGNQYKRNIKRGQFDSFFWKSRNCKKITAHKTLVEALIILRWYVYTFSDTERVFRVGKSINTDTNLITELRNRISELESDKAFLQKQVLDLQETIKLLTIKQLPEYQKGVFTRIKEFFTGSTPE